MDGARNRIKKHFEFMKVVTGLPFGKVRVRGEPPVAAFSIYGLADESLRQELLAKRMSPTLVIESFVSDAREIG